MVHMFEGCSVYVVRKFFIHTQTRLAGNAVANITVATSCNWWLFVAAIRCYSLQYASSYVIRLHLGGS